MVAAAKYAPAPDLRIVPAPRAIVYCRVSTSQQEQDGTSLDTQEAAGRAYCGERGYSIVAVYREVYTGAKYRERPDLGTARALVRDGGADVVVAYALDRLSRNQAHLAILAEEATDHGARLEFVTEDFEDSAVGRFIRSAKGFAAEIEREKIAERSVRGKIARIRAHKMMPGARPLYGYRWRDVTKAAYDLDETTAPIVRRIFADALAGTSMRAIARGLTADSIPTPKGGARWAPAVVHTMLKHPSYTGDASSWAWRCTGPTKTKSFDAEHAIALPAGTVPALVDRAAFAAVQDRLTRNKTEATRNNKTPENALLRGGYARCGYCGRVMRVHPRKRQASAYLCGGAYDPVNTCQKHCISVPLLDAAIWGRVRATLLDRSVIEREVVRLRSDDPTRADRTALDRRLAEIDRQRANLAKRLALFDDDESAAPVIAQLETLAKQRRQADAERAELDRERAGWEAAQTFLEDLGHWYDTVAVNLDGLDYAGRRVALDALGIDVRIYGTDHEPRYAVKARITLRGPIVSGTSSPSGHNSHVVLRWTDADELPVVAPGWEALAAD